MQPNDAPLSARSSYQAALLASYRAATEVPQEFGPVPDLEIKHWQHEDGQTGVQASIPHPFFERMPIATMRLYVDGEIMNVETFEGYRRRGVATAMLRYLEAHGVPFFHSKGLSTDGKAWVASLD